MKHTRYRYWCHTLHKRRVSRMKNTIVLSIYNAFRTHSGVLTHIGGILTHNVGSLSLFLDFVGATESQTIDATTKNGM